jgi:glycosyltransferase involved in cell wall biosynthesis
VRGLGLGLRPRVRAVLRRPDISFGHTFMRPPWGGSNQFLLALRDELERRGLRVAANAIASRTRAVLLNAYVFDERALRRQLHPECRVVHRVDGPLAVYRGFDDGTDEYIASINAELAHATIVQSEYSRRANAELGHTFRNPSVIANAVDGRIFFPGDRRQLGRKVRLVTTSWSDNENKGADTYAWLDQHLDWSRFEWTFVGRSPVEFTNIRTIPPTDSRGVAEILRAHDVFVFASRHESCSNALLEALACGLPAVYVDSGGNGELVGEGGVSFAVKEDARDALDRLAADYDERRAAISIPTIAQVADRYLEVLLP